MVKLIARIDVKPGREELVSAALRDLAVPSRAEAGCVQYVPCRSREDATKLLVLEEWASQEALDAHLETPHFQVFIETVGDAFAGPPQLEFVEPL